MSSSRDRNRVNWFRWMSRKGSPPRRRRSELKLTPWMQLLETRQLMAVYTVTNTADSGPGSLRQAIADANGAGSDTIDFDATVFSTPQTIDMGPGAFTLTDTVTTTINGPGAGLLTIDAQGTNQVFTLGTNASASISGLTITGGSGSGIYNTGSLTLDNCTITGNTGAGLLAPNTGGVSSILTNCIVSNNTQSGVTSVGTVLTMIDCTVSGNSDPGAQGGGVEAYVSTVTLTGCTVSGNTAGIGAGLWLRLGTATVTDCTVTDNTATTRGGGVVNYPGSSPTTILNCTITGNSAPVGGGLYTSASGPDIGNTIVAGNTATSGPDVDGAVTSQGSNLIGEDDGSSGWASDQLGTIATPLNALLSPLGAYGGPTQTIALLPGSPAINAGSNTLATTAGETTDERCPPRIANGTVDIGAYEVQTLYWDPTHTATGTGSGGTGTWDTSIANWFNGSADVAWSNTFFPVAVFAGTAGTVTLNTAIDASDLNLTTTGYTVTGNTLTLGVSGEGITVSSGKTESIATVLAGSAGLTFSGGTVTTTAANTYTGGTTITAGTLQVGTGGTATGSLGAGAVVDNGTLTLDFSNSINVANATSGTGTLNLTTTGGAITQGSPISVSTLTATAATGITLTTAGNALSSFHATNTTSGAISLCSRQRPSPPAASPRAARPRRL